MNINLNKLIKFFFLVIILFSTSCGPKSNQIKKPEKVPPLDILYKSAFNYFESGDWSSSIELFQKVETKYSFTEWAPRATLLIIYMYYETGDSYKTLEYIEKFRKTYPASKNLDYISYIKALTFYEQINVVSKDQTYTKVALKEFNKILKEYPVSIYAEESKLKIDLIYEQLAGKELYIARYYMEKSKWIAAIKRLKIILEKYDNTIYIKETLHRLVEVYYKLGNINEAKKYAAILGYNHNDSDWYKKSYNVVVLKNYSEKEKKSKKKLRDKIQNIFKFSK